ncbi:hypothetical protein Dsin_010196 [Dipteronia sinensis]|uniref:RRM domain-containing protein n=1 Tax=Dipteronia sinensis TaxID=43782 RepID=A0AAE0AS19_9ROSI|nr:hypothetical protein Dsin_010196 [Dipteronia sinensis]
MWSIFKPFGKVRDVFLSNVKRSRSSCYAFVRFGTVEEAMKVVNLTNRMLVYGWPIVSKMAMAGWNDRRTSENKTFSDKERIHMGGSMGRVSNYRNESFTEVLKGDRGKYQQSKEVIIENELFMSWSWNQKDSVWLDSCAVGLMREFSDVSGVNQRLEERVPRARLAWISFENIPLKFWCIPLFKKMASMIGDPLLVDDDVVFKTRLDKGLMLVEGLLGLVKFPKHLNGQPEVASIDEKLPKVDKGRGRRKRSQEKARCQAKKGSLKQINHKLGNFCHGNKKFGSTKVGDGSVDKGKGSWVKVSRHILRGM